MRVYKSNGSNNSNRDMAKKKRKSATKKKMVWKRNKRVAKKIYGAVKQNKQVAVLPVIPAYGFHILEQSKEPSVWDEK